MKKNTAGQSIGAQMITAADGTVFTGTVTVYVTGDAGTQAIGSVGSGICVHEGNGYHSYLPAQAETNYESVAFTFIGTGAVAATLTYVTSVDSNLLTVVDVPQTPGDIIGTIALISQSGSPVLTDTFNSVLTTVGTPAGTILNTHAQNDTYYAITNAAGAITSDFTDELEADGRAVQLVINGRLHHTNPGTDFIQVQYWNEADAVFANVDSGLIPGIKNSTSSDDATYTFQLDIDATGSVSPNVGRVIVRLVATGLDASYVMYVDKISVGFVSTVRSSGYESASVWFDSVGGETGTTKEINGISTRPCLNESDLNALLVSTKLKGVRSYSGSAFAAAQAYVGYEFKGNNWSFALGGQNLSSSQIEGASITGSALTPTGELDLQTCEVGAVTVNASHFDGCGLSSTVTLGGVNSDVKFINCYSLIAGSSTPILDFNTVPGIGHDVTFAGYRNGIQLDNYNASGVDNLSLEGVGRLIVSASSSGSIQLRGRWRVTNTGGATLVRDDETTVIELVQADTDELQTNQGNWLTATGFNIVVPPTLVEMTAAFTEIKGPTWTVTDTLEAIRDAIDTKASQTSVDDVPTNAEFNARTLAAADYFDPTTDPVEIRATGGIAGKNAEELVDDIADEPFTGATHNVPNSFAKRLRDLQEFGSYEGGAISVDTVRGSAGTTDYESGTILNAVNTIADANTLAVSLGLGRFAIAPGSIIALTVSQVDQIFRGSGWAIALGGQDISKSQIIGAQSVTGVGITPTGECHFIDCEFVSGTLGQAHLKVCGLAGTLTLSAAANYTLSACYSQIPGSPTPIIDFGLAVGATGLSMRSYSGGIEIQNYGALGVDTMSLEGNGQLVINANCVSGTVYVRGNFKVIDNSGGSVSIIYDDNTQGISDTLANTVGIEAKQDVAAAINTEVRLSELDAVTVGKMANQVDIIQVDTTTDIPATLTLIDSKTTNLPVDPASETNVNANETKIDSLATDIAAISTLLTTTGVTLTPAERTAVAAALMAHDMGDGRTVEQSLFWLRNKWEIIGGVLTVYATDDVTVSWTSAMTATAGDPISASDPT